MKLTSIYYKQYLESDEWKIKRAFILNRAAGSCERCGFPDVPLTVHHLHYRTLGREPMTDLEALCKACHEEADKEREAETREYRQNKRLDGWASKVYGEDWSTYMEYEVVEDAFEDWLERKEDGF